MNSVLMITTASGMTRPRKSAHLRLSPMAAAQRTSQSRDAISTTRAIPDISRLVLLVAPRWVSRSSTTCQDSPGPTDTPSRNLIWLITISAAEPEMKPLTTGRLSNCDRKPRRSRPTARTSTPEMSDSPAANVMYCGEPGGASGASTE